jgi:hypothetical protein
VSSGNGAKVSACSRICATAVYASQMFSHSNTAFSYRVDRSACWGLGTFGVGGERS